MAWATHFHFYFLANIYWTLANVNRQLSNLFHFRFICHLQIYTFFQLTGFLYLLLFCLLHSLSIQSASLFMKCSAHLLISYSLVTISCSPLATSIWMVCFYYFLIVLYYFLQNSTSTEMSMRRKLIEIYSCINLYCIVCSTDLSVRSVASVASVSDGNLLLSIGNFCKRRN